MSGTQSSIKSIPVSAGKMLLEDDAFPFEFLSQVAERESWRKEIYRPIYHVHKWWANRLGSVFRGILLGCALPPETHFEEAFYSQHELKGLTVFDPFMGSGTTIGESHKLGCTALGRDINPVAADAVRIVMGPLDRHLIHDEYQKLEQSVGRRIRDLYTVVDCSDQMCDVLYYFWVKEVACAHCGEQVSLFNSRIIGRNAFPNRKPEVRISCPSCGEIFTGSIHDSEVCCGTCGCRFNPKQGNTQGTKATCSSCSHTFAILQAVRKSGTLPSHRLIAKLILKADGTKQYQAATMADAEAYEECSRQLETELQEKCLELPDLDLQDGHNTRQAINYGYHAWRDFFNARQLLALGWLHAEIGKIDDVAARDALLTLFSATLEFNNLFASYKGEGTGAVRHMFSHHILKPERMPIEANVWGTKKSSGAFSGLYRTRLQRAIDYRMNPVEVRPASSGRRLSSNGSIQCSLPFQGVAQTTWPPVQPLVNRSIHLSCGSSDDTHLPDRSIDLVVTDPPFFDNVHYSELADFFFAWQALHPRGFLRDLKTTRSPKEVQDTNPEAFALKLGAVFVECERILKDEGALVFTYHHSRPDGWSSLATAIWSSGFSLVNAHPVRSELSVATPKSQAKEPIQHDVIMVCRKKLLDMREPDLGPGALTRAKEKAVSKVTRLRSKGFALSRGDRRIILISQFLAEIGPAETAHEVTTALDMSMQNLESTIDDIAFAKDIDRDDNNVAHEFFQRSLFAE